MVRQIKVARMQDYRVSVLIILNSRQPLQNVRFRMKNDICRFVQRCDLHSNRGA